jgi:hypothetical protein
MRLFLLAGLLVLTACSTPAPDQAQVSSPGPTTATTTTATTTATQETPEPEVPEVTRKEPVKWARPCELLDLEKDYSRNGDKEIEVPVVPGRAAGLYAIRIKEDTDDFCRWEYFLHTHLQYQLKVTVYRSKGVDEATLDPNWDRGEYAYFDITVGGRGAKRVEAQSAGDCGIALPTGNGHVFVEMQTHDLLGSCIMARTAAEQIEPSLPA